ncbi:MAG: hypothetical protein WBO36_11360, partial [Saprospiraceae bacterium]
FGQLYLDKILQLDPIDNKRRLENLQATINKLSRFQQSSGKFNYWDNSYYHAWSDIYAGNLLIEMSRLGYYPKNSDMLNRWLDAHVQSANKWALAELTSDYVYESESLAQAFRLFVLAKASKPAKSAMNRFVTSNHAKNNLTWWLIAGSFQLSGYDSKASEYLSKAESLQMADNHAGAYGSFGDSGRDYALIVEILSYFKQENKRLEDYYDKMVETLNSTNWTSTQTMGYSFIAAYKYFGKSLDMVDKVNYTFSCLGTLKNFQHSSYEPKLMVIEKSGFDKNLSIQNKGKGKLYVYQSDRYIDDDLIKSASSSNLGLNVNYFNATRNEAGLKNIKLGDDLIITVKVSNPSALEQDNLALNVKMPSGWELINPRLYATDEKKTQDYFMYQDFRDDRVYTFFKLGPGDAYTYSFRIKAAFTGDFFMPSVTCENMYKGNVNARSESQRVKVLR